MSCTYNAHMNCADEHPIQWQNSPSLFNPTITELMRDISTCIYMQVPRLNDEAWNLAESGGTDFVRSLSNV